MAGNSFFQFKQFVINQENCAMKVGTDGVLLGAWAPLQPSAKLLDIGTGTGLVALMTAQRGAGSVTAVEIDRDAAKQASENVMKSPWSNSVQVINADILSFAETGELFDVIVCNPPFFRDSLRSPDSVRSVARHNDTLSYEALALSVSKLLTENGSFSVILPSDLADEFVLISAKNGLYLCRRCSVITKEGNPPKRELMQFCRTIKPAISEKLIMTGAEGNESEYYVSLVKDFYLRY